MTEVMRIVVVFDHYQDEDGDGIQVETTPSKNVEGIKALNDGTFVTTAVISNAIEIVAHNSEAAIYVAKMYGDEGLVKLLRTHGYDQTLVRDENIH